ncbi:hypothetical protein [Kitasatospora indigofera]|uniref:hypothetical protein n=1 Tax=Kitasatospora indigofera TaxID=67307 RepID=UPI0033AB84DE
MVGAEAEHRALVERWLHLPAENELIGHHDVHFRGTQPVEATLVHQLWDGVADIWSGHLGPGTFIERLITTLLLVNPRLDRSVAP